MARIQILELPMEHVGEFSSTPFVIVIDRLEHERVVSQSGDQTITVGTDEQAVLEAALSQGFKEMIGAKAILIHPGELEIG